MTFLTVMEELSKNGETSNEGMSSSNEETKHEASRDDEEASDAAEEASPSEVPSHVVQKIEKTLLDMINSAKDLIKDEMKKLENITLFGETNSNDSSIEKLTLADIKKYIKELIWRVDTFSTEVTLSIHFMTQDILNILTNVMLTLVKIEIHDRLYPNMDYPSHAYHLEDDDIEHLPENLVGISRELIFSKKHEILDILRGLMRSAQCCAIQYFVGVKSMTLNVLTDMENISKTTLEEIEALSMNSCTEESSENGESEANMRVQSLIGLISDKIDDVIRDATVQLDSSQGMSGRILEEEIQNNSEALESIITTYFDGTEHWMREIFETSPRVFFHGRFFAQVSMGNPPFTVESVMGRSAKEANEAPKNPQNSLISVSDIFRTKIKGELKRFLHCVKKTSTDNLEQAEKIKGTAEKKIQDILEKCNSIEKNSTEEIEDALRAVIEVDASPTDD